MRFNAYNLNFDILTVGDLDVDNLSTHCAVVALPEKSIILLMYLISPSF
jgi:hypothetical protein